MAAQFLNFVVHATSGPGTFEVTGLFDESWGFRINQGPAGYQRFKYIGFAENNRFRINLEDDGGVNIGFSIRFSSNNDDYTPSTSGAIVVGQFSRTANPGA